MSNTARRSGRRETGPSRLWKACLESATNDATELPSKAPSTWIDTRNDPWFPTPEERAISIVASRRRRQPDSSKLSLEDLAKMMPPAPRDALKRPGLKPGDRVGRRAGEPCEGERARTYRHTFQGHELLLDEECEKDLRLIAEIVEPVSVNIGKPNITAAIRHALAYTAWHYKMLARHERATTAEDDAAANLALDPCPNPTCDGCTRVFVPTEPERYGITLFGFAAVCSMCSMYGPVAATRHLAADAWNALPRSERPRKRR